MIRPATADIGRRVVWTNRLTGEKRAGRLDHMRWDLAWVVYDGDPEGEKPRATMPCVLDWEAP